MRGRIAGLIAGIGSIAAIACGLSYGGAGAGDGGVDASTFDGNTDDVISTSDATLDDAADGGTGDSASLDGGCPDALPGPSMVPAADFCIDSTEVTKDHYAKFLAAMGDGGLDGGFKVPPECGFKKVGGDLVPSTWDPTTNGQFPVTYVDWCDAVLYCRWSGKRLCGKRGGGTLDWNEASNAAAKSQWYAACSQDGLRTYAYGATWDPAKCRVDDTGQKPTYVGSYKACVGGYPGLFDMTGNVGEWIDQCQGPAKNDNCKIQGGDYGTDDNGSMCDAVQDRDRDNATEDWVGFRCCR